MEKSNDSVVKKVSLETKIRPDAVRDIIKQINRPNFIPVLISYTKYENIKSNQLSQVVESLKVEGV